MLCCICKEKEATVHLTVMATNKMNKLDLCEECAEKKGLSQAELMDAADIVSSHTSED
jgi:protein arginine kinase activator